MMTSAGKRGKTAEAPGLSAAAVSTARKGPRKRGVYFLRVAPFVDKKLRHPQEVKPPLDIALTMKLLRKQDIQVHILDTWINAVTPAAAARKAARHNPAVIAVSTCTPGVAWAKKFICYLRKLTGAPIVMFGQHPSTLPETFLLHENKATTCIIGEPELTMAALVPRLLSGEMPVNMPGTAWYSEKKGQIINNGVGEGIRDMDKMPYPDYGPFISESYKVLCGHATCRGVPLWGFLMTSRGCPYRCAFCSPTLRLVDSRVFVAASPERVVEEAEYLVNRHGVTALCLDDDIFTYDRQRVIEICALFRKRNIRVPWVCQTRADLVDPELMKIMKQSGCTRVKIGVETGSNRIMRILKKDLDTRQVFQAARAIREAGLQLAMTFMIGNPGETLRDIEKSYALAHKCRPDMIQVAMFTPYPGSEYYDRARHSEQRPRRFSDFSHYYGITANMSQVDTATLLRWQRYFYRGYYLSPGYMRRYLGTRWKTRMHQAPVEELWLILQALIFMLAGRR